MTPEQTTLGALVANGRLILGDGYRTKQAELGRPGVPILRVRDVQDGFLKPDLSDYVSESYRRQFASKVSRPNDVVVTTKGTVGRVARISQSDPEFVYSPQLCFFRVPVENSGLDPTFLYYWFRSPEFQDQARRVKAQTDMADYVNLVDMRAIRIVVPPFERQQRIAMSLAAFEAKIELNRRMNETLDQLANEIFRREVTEAARADSG